MATHTSGHPSKDEPNFAARARPIFYDWVGSAALQEDIVAGRPLEELCGLSPNDWTVVGIDIDTRTTSSTHTRFRAYAFDRRTAGLIGTTDVLGALARHGDTHGEIPVHALTVDLDAARVLAQMKYAVVRLQATRLRHHKLTIITT